MTGSAQILRYRLEIQHQLRVIAYVLSDFIHQENHMVVVAFAVDIFLDQLGKIFDADLIAFRRFLAPVTGGGFAHKAHLVQDINDVILNKIELMARSLPRFAEISGKFFFELFVAPRLTKSALQISQERNGAAESLHFIEHF